MTMMTQFIYLFIIVIFVFLTIHSHKYTNVFLLFASIVLCPFVILAFRVTQIKTYSWDNAQVVLVGNKSDMQNERVVTYDRGKQFADHLGV